MRNQFKRLQELNDNYDEIIERAKKNLKEEQKNFYKKRGVKK